MARLVTRVLVSGCTDTFRVPVCDGPLCGLLWEGYRDRKQDGMVVRNSQVHAKEMGGGYASTAHQVQGVPVGMCWALYMLFNVEAIQQ